MIILYALGIIESIVFFTVMVPTLWHENTHWAMSSLFALTAAHSIMFSVAYFDLRRFF